MSAVGRITLITARKPDTLAKVFSLGASGLEKRTAAHMIEGSATVKEFATVQDFVSLLESVGHNQAITASLPTNGRDSVEILTTEVLANHPGKGTTHVARGKAYFGLSDSQPGVFVLDYDPPPGAQALDRAALWDLVREVMPDAANAGVVWWSSGSSFIYNGDREIQGLRGQRVYIFVKSVGDTERAADMLAKRLWLSGRGRVDISVSGQRLVRSVFDAAMAQPARLDFIGGSVCEAPLEQRRGSPVILSDGGWLDTLSALPDLTSDELRRYENLVDRAKEDAEPEVRKMREAYIACRVTGGAQRLIKAGVPENQAAERAERSLKSALGGVLLGDFELSLEGGACVTVGEVLDNRERYHGALTLDPLEQEYLGRKVVGKLYLMDTAPRLYSFAHGGAVYNLRRQPARLTYRKGSAAELATEIRALLAKEPDVFVSGGQLVRFDSASGQTKVLHRAALAHLIGSRFAIYTPPDKNGKAHALEVPPSVIDMIGAL